MNEFILYAIIASLAAIVGFILWKKRGKPEDSGFLMIQNQLSELRNAVDAKLGDSNKMFQRQFESSSQVIKEITEKLTRLDETNKQVVNFADQLQTLQDTLQNPKHRGVFGEYYLESLLKNVLSPKQYQMQYKFKGGDIVDAVVFLGDGKIVPIDSKFSLENYNRIVEEKDENRRKELEKMFIQDLKNRIDETSKYIRPQDGTTEYAFMFIPAEGIYYDLLVNKIGALKSNTRDLLDYSINEKKVVIVSPTTFYVTLQALWQGMRAHQMHESTKDILQKVSVLQRHLKAYDEYHEKIGSHLGTVVNTYNRASKEFKKIDKDVFKITGSSNDINIPELQSPEKED